MEGSTQSLKALGLSPGCCKLLACSQRGSATCSHFFNSLEPKAWIFLAATMADAAFPSLRVSVPHCQVGAQEGSLSLCRCGHVHCLMSETWYHVLGLGLP